MSASENITDNGRTRLRGLLDAGDPYGDVRDAWHAKETLRAIYDIADAEVGAATVNQLAQDLQDPAMPAEINRLGRTIWNWRHQIANWHAARVTNAATEAKQPPASAQKNRPRLHQPGQLRSPRPPRDIITPTGASNPQSHCEYYAKGPNVARRTDATPTTRTRRLTRERLTVPPVDAYRLLREQLMAGQRLAAGAWSEATARRQLGSLDPFGVLTELPYGCPRTRLR